MPSFSPASRSACLPACSPRCVYCHNVLQRRGLRLFNSRLNFASIYWSHTDWLTEAHWNYQSQRLQSLRSETFASFSSLIFLLEEYVLRNRIDSVVVKLSVRMSTMRWCTPTHWSCPALPRPFLCCYQPAFSLAGRCSASTVVWQSAVPCDGSKTSPQGPVFIFCSFFQIGPQSITGDHRCSTEFGPISSPRLSRRGDFLSAQVSTLSYAICAKMKKQW